MMGAETASPSTVGAVGRTWRAPNFGGEKRPGYRMLEMELNYSASIKHNDFDAARAIDRIVIINDLSEAKGGATGLALLAARLLVERGLSVTYICGDDAANIDPQYEGVSFVPVGGETIMQSSKLRAMYNGIHNRKTIATIRNWIAENDTPNTVYHLHGWSKILSPSVFIALKSIYHRLIVHAHDFFIACPNGAFFDYKKSEICRRTPLGPACLATQCDKRNYAQKLWRSGRQVAVSHSGVAGKDGPRIVMIHDAMRSFLRNGGYSDERLSSIRNPYRILSDTRIRVEDNSDIFFIGRIEEEKGIEDLARASRLAGVKLRVIGHGPLSERLEKEFPEIDWLGWRRPTEIADLVKTARCTVLPSRYPEPFGLVALEALTSGIPVLFSKDAFLAEEANAGGYAFAADTRDHQALASLLRRIMAMSRREIQTMSELAFQNSSKLATTPQQWAEALILEYLSVI
jgi:glycosyltransferase involved in cell wall biosynthesis